MLTQNGDVYQHLVVLGVHYESFWMAERKGFEPLKQLPVYTLSKRAPSTTQPPLQLINNSHILLL